MAFYVTLLLMAVLFGSTESLTGTEYFRSNLPSWYNMSRRAGYYSSSGWYKGGIYKGVEVEMSNAYSYSCTNSVGPFCQDWTMESQSSGYDFSESCNCTSTPANNDAYCQTWSCQKHGVSHSERHKDADWFDVDCVCHTSSTDEIFCSGWSCQDVDGRNEFSETHDCRREDMSGKYCTLWDDTTESRENVGTTVCKCTPGTEFCEARVCITRELKKCNQHRAGWCNFGLAVAIGYISGAVFLVTVVVASRYTQRKMHYFPLSLLVAMIVISTVILYGGIMAFLTVFPFWIILLVYPLIITMRACVCTPDRFEDRPQNQPLRVESEV